MADERRDRGQGRPGEGGRPGGGGRQGDGRPQDGRQAENRQGDGSRGRRFGRRRNGRPGDARSQDSRQNDARQQDGRQGHGQSGNGPGGTSQPGGGQQGNTRREHSLPPRDLVPPLPKLDPVTCPLCGKPVYDLSTALSAEREKSVPAHFDCVVERVSAAENVGPGERLVYLGSGAFGVVEFKDKSETAFVIKRRVQWEKEGEKQDWRKILSARIAHI